MDQEGEVLESYVTNTRDKGAALSFIKKAPKRHGSPEAVTTDGLRSYKAAMGELGNAEIIKRAMKRHGKVEAIITDGLRSYKAALDKLGCPDKQEVGRWTNNRAENSHLPFRRRERAMLRFRQMESLQKFASVHASFHNTSARSVTPSIDTYRNRRSAALAEWQNLMA